jgi:hypothetical protein
LAKRQKKEYASSSRISQKNRLFKLFINLKLFNFPKEGETATLSVPHHSEVARCTLRSLIAKAGLTVE